jgi:chromosome segregation ATPase
MDWLSGIAALLNGFAAVAAWVVNTWWSKKYIQAKDESITSLQSTIENLKTSHSEIIKAKDTVIEAKNASIDAIKENTPQIVSTAYKATVEVFDDSFKRMQEKLAQTKKEISELEASKTLLSEERDNLRQEKTELQSERDNLRQEKTELQSEIEELRVLADAMQAHIDHQEDLAHDEDAWKEDRSCKD